MTPDDELAHIITLSNTLVVYDPLPGEPDWQECPVLAPIRHTQGEGKDNLVLIPQDTKVDPFEAAKGLQEAVLSPSTGSGQAPVTLIIPGTAFDPYGGRKGRGGGWYDRLLSALPKDWVRVGVCHESQLSHQPLPQASWDESVDFVVVKMAERWVILKCHGQRNA